MKQAWVASPFSYRRRPTREVRVGEVGIGAGHPIRIQSMTTRDTRDTQGVARQVEQLVEVGCEIVRITAPSLRDAENLAAIRQELDRRGIHVPLVADIHFTPNAALVAAEHVEKVRINPGNYADKKRFEHQELSDARFREEVERVQERFRPLVRRLRELGRALRIGTNHGSLSDRILSRYGDTPLGMVESALEFLEVCEEESFFDVVFSMKASNPQVAIQAYRLLAARLAQRAPDVPGYPFHVGVTEAGGGEEGRIKSAIGIGALLEDGLGDTIRVSLTEDPVREVPVARLLAARFDTRPEVPEPTEPGASFVADPFRWQRRPTARLQQGAPPCELALGDGEPVRVEVELGRLVGEPAAAAEELCRAAARSSSLALEGLGIQVEEQEEVPRAIAFAEALAKRDCRVPLAVRAPAALMPRLAGVASRWVLHFERALPSVSGSAWTGPVEWCLVGEPSVWGPELERSLARGRVPDLLSLDSPQPVHAARWLVARLQALGHPRLPLLLRHRADPLAPPAEIPLRAATELGALLCDGIGDAICLGGPGPLDRTLALAYRILQGARQRTSWTEFISCPSCGRTLFDLEETTARIQACTQHLRGLKIAVMGCIVNGPGEMADADFGYVGSGPGRVNLYVGQSCVVRNVPEQAAPERLVELIREHGRWEDPS